MGFRFGIVLGFISLEDALDFGSELVWIAFVDVVEWNTADAIFHTVVTDDVITMTSKLASSK